MSDNRPERSVIVAERLWPLIGGMGLLFTVVAGADNLLTWIPADFGNREWEFGTVTASLNGFLSIAFGLALIQLWLSQSDSSRALKALGIVHLSLGLGVVGAALLYWTTVPVAWAAVPDTPVRTGLLKAIIKTSFQSVAYPISFFLLARSAFLWAGQIARATAKGAKGGQRVGGLRRN